ncbi:MAG: creatininase family protein [Desulfopila sp.]|jgi:creatinine amidohydrolase|nr:creatininase family protein [Desulfopila sp.]
MLLENLSYPEVVQYLRDKDTILVPVGSVEQHSEYGIIGTDFIAAEAVAREAGMQLGILVAPTIHYGVSCHHMGFAGSASVSPVTFVHLITDICLSFAHHGFMRIIFVNGHGGNRNAIATAFQEVKMRGAAGQFALLSWYEGLQETALIEELFQGDDGSHATPSEISLTMLLRPEVFAGKKTAPGSLQKKEYCWPLTREEMRSVFPDGRMGSASWLASADKGEQIMALAVRTLVEKIEKLRAVALV